MVTLGVGIGEDVEHNYRVKFSCGRVKEGPGLTVFGIKKECFNINEKLSK